MSQLLEATELDDVQAVLSSAYGSMRIHPRGHRRGMRLSRASLGPLWLDDLSFAMSFLAEAAPLGVLAFGRLRSGRVRRSSDGSERRCRPGQVFLAAQPDHPYTAAVEDAEAELAIIDPALPSQVADTAPGRSRQPVRFTGYEPVSAQAAGIWASAYSYVRDAILAVPEASAMPLVMESAARLLVATALAVFPNNALTEPTAQDRRDASPATLRRAVTFIDENASRDITVADVADAASLTIRAVQLAFRRHLNTTPMAYLRKVRLEQARRDLLAADPDHQTVTAVAYRWGFASPSRFAAYYRKAYGVQPSETLAR